MNQYKDRTRDKAFIGAIIQGAKDISGGIINIFRKREMERQQKRQEQIQRTSNAIQQESAANNAQIQNINQYRNDFMDQMMRCGGTVKKACGGKYNNRKKAKLGSALDWASVFLGAGASIGSALDQAAQSKRTQLSNGPTNTTTASTPVINTTGISQMNQQQLQATSPAQIAQQTNSTIIPNKLEPVNIGTNSDNVIGADAIKRYGGNDVIRFMLGGKRRRCWYGKKC